MNFDIIGIYSDRVGSYAQKYTQIVHGYNVFMFDIGLNYEWFGEILDSVKNPWIILVIFL